MSDIRKALRGHSIVGLYLHDDKEQLAIIVGGTDYMVSVVMLSAYGDCCSGSWIEHIGNPEACDMSRFDDWIEVNLPIAQDKLSEEDRSALHNGELKFYFYQIITSKGETVIEMRNMSNGYYGGELIFKEIVPFLSIDLEAKGFHRVREG